MLAGMNQLWRRNIKKAAKHGVVVAASVTASDLPAFHQRYVETAERDHFTPRPLSYFQHMFDALGPRTPTGSGSTSPTTRATSSPRRPGPRRRARLVLLRRLLAAKREVRGSTPSSGR